MKNRFNMNIDTKKESKMYHNNKTEKITEKAIFGELYQVRKINNLVHKLTFSIQKNKDLISDNYPHLEGELSYLQKELDRVKNDRKNEEN